MEKLKLSRIKLLTASAPLLLVLSVVLVGSSNVTMAKIASETSGKLRFDPGSDYVAHCTRCHGGDGRGQTAKGRKTHAGDLTKSRVGDAKGIRMITNGSGEMPAFKSSMNADQIRGVMGYVRGFRR